MNEFRDSFVIVLNQIMDIVKKLSEDELRDIINGDARLRFSVEKSSRKSCSKSNLKSQDRLKLKATNSRELIDHLNLLDDRTDGYKTLTGCCTGRNDLVEIAKTLDLPISKRDSIERLRDKIIEATIGYRLRSRAIQGGEKLSE